MNCLRVLLLCVGSLLPLPLHAEDSPAAIPTDVPDAIFKFMQKPEPAYQWTLQQSESLPQGKIHELKLVSQVWHEITWQHVLMVYEPTKVTHPGHALLFVTGGSMDRRPGDGDRLMGVSLANLCGAPVAMLYQVPNQPLLGNRKEDDLITETWLRYLDTGDETWPLLFPMVKSAMKAMDAVQEFSQKQWQREIKSFVITGASKRGWTSWLTPVVDKRIVATAPIVIDVLNFREQMKFQLATWGDYSEQIHDYTSKGLVKTPDQEESDRERRLREMMDPWTYRRHLSLPKLMIVGTNDPYWVVNAMSVYWDDLTGPKYVLEVPNGDHGLGDGRAHALNTLSVYFQHIAGGLEMPKITFKQTNAEGELGVLVSSEPAPVAVRLWSATAPKQDFRQSQWTSQEIPVTDGSAGGAVKLPKSGQAAVFAELEYEFQGRKWSLTTMVFRR